MTNDITALLSRLARLNAAESWAADLTPVQAEALTYLGRANRFSRAPSHVADYLGATRGTVSQTLKTLLRHGLIDAVSSPEDRRSIRYDLTPDGEAALGTRHVLEQVISALPAAQKEALAAQLRTVLQGVVDARGDKMFGICRTCRHHRSGTQGPRCALLGVDLSPTEAEQICQEHSPA